MPPHVARTRDPTARTGVAEMGGTLDFPAYLGKSPRCATLIQGRREYLNTHIYQ
jgi:hypothetical protein